MAKLIKTEKTSIKNNREITEDMIQKFISEDPSVLGIGDLTTIQREKSLPSGGRIDILLGDDAGTRYEVEVQLGATDESHIIRTIEYWDIEKKRYPQYDHCAVIVAENITGRFMNVISLFNGSIPLIAIQMSAIKTGDGYQMVFTKVLDRITIVTEEDEGFEPKDRDYWESRSTKNMMSNVDKVFKELGELVDGYEYKFNKYYIGLSKNGIVRNFIAFQPRKNFINLRVQINEDETIANTFEEAGFEINWLPRWKRYDIKIESMSKFNSNKELFLDIVKRARQYYNIDPSDE